MKRLCEYCNTGNEFISAKESVRCNSCGKMMDWRLKHLCPYCDTLNILLERELNTASCRKCHSPLIYVPNTISLKNRVLSVVISATLISLSGYAIYTSKLELPIGGRKSYTWYEFYGLEMTLPILAIILACLSMLSSIADHYDKRPNERTYRKFESYSSFAAFVFYMLSIFVGSKA